MSKLENPRYEKVAKQVATGKTYKEVVRKVYPNQNRNSQHVTVNRLQNNPVIEERVKEIMTIQGNTPEKLLEKLDTLVEATEKLSYQGKLTGDERPDNRLQFETTKYLLSLWGVDMDKNQTNIQLNQDINTIPEGLREHLGELNKNLREMRAKMDEDNEIQAEFTKRD